MVAELGGEEPAEAVGTLMAFLDGSILHRLVVAAPVDPRPGLGRVTRAVLAPS